MPLRDFECAACGKQQERYFQQTSARISVTARGSLVTNVTEEQTDPVYPTCESCGGTLTVLPLAQDPRRYVGSVFPFTTTHITADGSPMVVENMSHLRAVERKYGVVLSAFSKASNNDLSPIQDLPRYRGQDPDFHKSGY